jgi:hypothetical protein
LQTDAVSNQSQAACQAMAALLLANVHAPECSLAISLTDLQDSSIFWLDRFSIMYYGAGDAATAGALTNALLALDQMAIAAIHRIVPITKW